MEDSLAGKKMFLGNFRKSIAPRVWGNQGSVVGNGNSGGGHCLVGPLILWGWESQWYAY